jgi:HK97 gp10 family phage protein
MAEIVKFTGGKQLEAALRELPKATARNALQRGLKKAAQPVADDWKAKAPRDEGHLEKSIIVGPSSKLTKRQRKDAIKEGPYFAEIHVGTADPAGQQQEYGNINHPAQPSGRPAWDGNKQQALDTMGKEMWAEIQKAAARRAKKIGI